MIKKVKSMNEISGRRINKDVLLSETINSICKNYFGFIRYKIFINELYNVVNILLEFSKESEVMNNLDGSVEKIENELRTAIPYALFSVKFYILYK